MAYNRHFASIGRSLRQHLYLRNGLADFFQSCRDYSMSEYKQLFKYFLWGPIGPTGDELGQKWTFHTFCQVSQNQFCKFVLVHAYTFLWMSSISHKELVPIESLKEGPLGPDVDYQ